MDKLEKEEIEKKITKILDAQKDMPTEFGEIVNKNFFELLDVSVVSEGGYPIKDEEE